MASNISVIVDNLFTKEVNECSHGNCLVKQLTLVVCGVNNYSKLLHHMCQNNMYHSVYDGSFESKFGLVFRCPECITIAIKSEDSKMSCNKKLFKTSKNILDTLEYISSEEEAYSEKIYI